MAANLGVSEFHYVSVNFQKWQKIFFACVMHHEIAFEILPHMYHARPKLFTMMNVPCPLQLLDMTHGPISAKNQETSSKYLRPRIRRKQNHTRFSGSRIHYILHNSDLAARN